MTVDVLPDDVLVEIFCYVNRRDNLNTQNPWHALVHVCRRWRYLVFASPCRLNLQLDYRGHGPIPEVLDAWPVLPLIIRGGPRENPRLDPRWDNRVAAFESEHHNRICEIRLSFLPISRWNRFTAAMRKPFPELTYLYLSVCNWGSVSVLPESFLGGSAPRLRELSLTSISFPSIPKLLLSVHSLVDLSLWDIPDSGYFSPDAMATTLKVMTRLESLHLQFRSPRSRPDPASRPLLPPTRSVLPALTKLIFGGVYEYLEDLLTRIDAPLLCYLYVDFFMDLNFDLPQLHRLIGHAEEFKAYNHAKVVIFDFAIDLSLYHKTGPLDCSRRLELRIQCGELDWQLSSLAQFCSPSFPLISTLEELEIRVFKLSSSHWKDDMGHTRWLELLDSFTALKNLYLTCGVAQRVCGTLQEVSGERATEVLPALRNLFVDGFRSLEHIQEAIGPFVAARQLSGHPVAIDHWR